MLAALRTIAKALFATPQMPDAEASKAILAHLAENGRTRTQDLWRMLRKQTTAGAGHVSLAKLHWVLERLEDEGEVYAMRETSQGRTQAYWNLNTFGGGRRARERTRAAPTGAGALATA